MHLCYCRCSAETEMLMVFFPALLPLRKARPIWFQLRRMQGRARLQPGLCSGILAVFWLTSHLLKQLAFWNSLFGEEIKNGSNLQQVAKEQCRCKFRCGAACEVQAVGLCQEVKLCPASLTFCVSPPSTSPAVCILGKMDLCAINRNTIYSTQTFHCLDRYEVQSFPIKLIFVLLGSTSIAWSCVSVLHHKFWELQDNCDPYFLIWEFGTAVITSCDNCGINGGVCVCHVAQNRLCYSSEWDKIIISQLFLPVVACVACFVLTKSKLTCSKSLILCY